MPSTSAKPIDQESLLHAIRAHVEKAGGDKGRISMKRFLASAGLRQQDIFRFYPSWNDALRAIGVDFDPWTVRIASEKLLTDWGGVARKFKRIPNSKLYNIHGKYGQTTLSKRFGRWSSIAAAFREFAAAKSEWADVLAMAEGEAQRERGKGRTSLPPGHVFGTGTNNAGRKWVTGRQRRQDQVSFGAPLPLPALRNSPVNENGVIYLFGVLADRLGFSVEAVRAAYPDCIAKRRMATEEWHNVRIEFEYESRNFRDHQHPPEGCDIIVCWAHNWADCPEDLEVIALSEEIKKL